MFKSAPCRPRSNFLFGCFFPMDLPNCFASPFTGVQVVWDTGSKSDYGPDSEIKVNSSVLPPKRANELYPKTYNRRCFQDVVKNSSKVDNFEDLFLEVSSIVELSKKDVHECSSVPRKQFSTEKFVCLEQKAKRKIEVQLQNQLKKMKNDHC